MLALQKGAVENLSAIMVIFKNLLREDPRKNIKYDNFAAKDWAPWRQKRMQLEGSGEGDSLDWEKLERDRLRKKMKEYLEADFWREEEDMSEGELNRMLFWRMKDKWKRRFLRDGGYLGDNRVEVYDDVKAEENLYLYD